MMASPSRTPWHRSIVTRTVAVFTLLVTCAALLAGFLVHLFDASGRAVQRIQLTSAAGRSGSFSLGGLAPGLYIGALDQVASGSFRIFHQP